MLLSLRHKVGALCNGDVRLFVCSLFDRLFLCRQRVLIAAGAYRIVRTDSLSSQRPGRWDV